jgi:hypothetical protein
MDRSCYNLPRNRAPTLEALVKQCQLVNCDPAQLRAHA